MRTDRAGIPLGHIFGISIFIDWSWIFIFLLVTWSLGAGLFPSWHPYWSSGLSWLIAVAAALLFFASILAHELAHSLVAKARGLPVHSITLFIFGGVSNLQHEPASPGTEFLMAIVGPLTSVGLGFGFWFLGGVVAGQFIGAGGNPMSVAARLGPLATLLAWLGPVNILIGFFNMIPGFPLDGGRVLRSILWSITRDLRKATRWASFVGQVIAWLFILGGIAMVFGLSVPVFGTGFVGGLWLAFIGWFLNNAAISSRQVVIIEEMLHDVPVSRLMRIQFPSIPQDMDVNSLVHDWMMGTEERAFPVMDGEHLAGLVSLEDVRKLPRETWGQKSVSEIMTPVNRLAIVSPTEEAVDAWRKLNEAGVRQVPVMDDGHLVGMLRRRDIMKWLQLHSELSAH